MRLGLGRMVVGVAVVFAVATAALGAVPDSVGAQSAGTRHFSDDDGSVHEPGLEALAARGVLAGMECGEGLICPTDPLKRWEMAVWLVRVLDGTDPDPIDASRFADVDAAFWWAPFVDRLFALEVTEGCRTEPARFCPNRDVTRAQMATSLKRAFALEAADPAGFVDVDAGGTHSANIDALAAAGITVGCRAEPLRYCPDRDVNRAQMATFLARALGLVETPPSAQYIAVDVGAGHACALRTDATIACWGDNRQGQANPPEGTFKSVTAGYEHSCGLRADDTIACWGTDVYKLMDVPEGQFQAVSAGVRQSCGLRSDGTVACWGSDSHGESSPPDGQFQAVSAGSRHSCGLRANGTIVCWGEEYRGQSSAPEGQFQAVSAGDMHSCGLRANGTITCWGDNSHYQSSAPAGSFTAVSTGNWNSCGVRVDGTIACWGANYQGQAEVPDGRFVAVSAGYVLTCGLSVDGTVVCSGRLAQGSATDVSDTPGHLFSMVSAGQGHSCGVRTDGALACWGSDRASDTAGASYAFRGQFIDVSTSGLQSCGVRADGTIVCWGNDERVTDAVPDGQFTSVSTNGWDTCGLRTDGTVACWGPRFGSSNRPPRGHFSAISTGSLSSCGVRTDGTVRCWNHYARVPDYSPDGRFIAVDVGYRYACGVRIDGTIACWGGGDQADAEPPDGQFTAVAAGWSHTCALRADGTIACWGDGWSDNAHTPQGQFAAISAGGDHTCALRLDGSTVCWDRGQSEPAPIGVRRSVSSTEPDPDACRPFGGLSVTAGFPLPSVAPTAKGQIRVAVLFVDFHDAPATSSTQTEALRGLPYAERYLESASYGKLDLRFSPVHRWLRAELGYASYGRSTDRADHSIHGHIDDTAARLAGPDYNSSDYDLRLIVMPGAYFGGANAGGPGLSDIERTSRINTDYWGSRSGPWGPTAAHEMAHNLGLADLYPRVANLHFLPTVPPAGKAWLRADLGLMGFGGWFAASPREGLTPIDAPEMLAWSRWQLGWLDDDQIRCISEPDATVMLSPVADPGDGIAMAAVPLSEDDLIVIESRRRIGYDKRAALGEGRVIVYTVDAGIDSGRLPIKLAGDAGRGHTLVNPILSEGDSITVRGYTITVIADDGDTHTVTITRVGAG